MKSANDILTFFASPERDSLEDVQKVSEQLKKEILLPWFNAVPISVVVVNEHRQILFCNDAFNKLCLKSSSEEIVGKRPGEALECLHSTKALTGCGCSEYCDVCGAANAIIKSLDGEEDCQECRMMRMVGNEEVPLDLQVFTKPIEFHGKTFTLFFALDISHELRLQYLNRTFHHGLINSAGGITALTEMIDADEQDAILFPLLLDSSRRLMRDVLYHRDVTAAEQNRLAVEVEPIETRPYLTKLVGEECSIRNTQCSFLEMDIQCDTFESDKRVLSHVLRNMLVNALEAREEVSGPITLSCMKDSEGKAVISLSNPGEVGSTIRKQIFKRYVSTKSHDRGLGTYVMKLLTEKFLGGKVDFTSKNNTTTFTVTLP